MEMNSPDRECMEMLLREARMHDHVAHLRAHAMHRWTRAWCRQEGRERTCEEKGTAADPIDTVLTVIESDLCYLEELPAGRIASSKGMLGEMDDRLKRVIASLKRPS